MSLRGIQIHKKGEWGKNICPFNQIPELIFFLFRSEGHDEKSQFDKFFGPKDSVEGLPLGYFQIGKKIHEMVISPCIVNYC